MLLLPSGRLSVLAFPARGQQGITVLIATATYLFFWSEMNMSSATLFHYFGEFSRSVRTETSDSSFDGI